MKHVWTPPNTVRPTLILVYIPNSRYIMYYSYSALFFLCIKSIFLLYHDISLRGTWANIVVGLCYFLFLSSVVMQVRRTSSLDWRLSRRVNQVIATYNDTKRIIHVVVQLWKFRLPLDTEKTKVNDKSRPPNWGGPFIPSRVCSRKEGLMFRFLIPHHVIPLMIINNFSGTLSALC